LAGERRRGSDGGSVDSGHEEIPRHPEEKRRGYETVKADSFSCGGTCGGRGNRQQELLNQIQSQHRAKEIKKKQQTKSSALAS